MQIEENVSLAKFTSLHVGGEAKYFIRTKDDKDLVTAFDFAKEKNIPFFVLGKGSNTLFSDDGFDGLIIHMEDRELTVSGSKIRAASGVFLRQLVNFSHEHGLVGLEELAGIPGTVGGAVRGNAGTWSTEIKDLLVSAEVIKLGDSVDVITIGSDEINFGYRHSAFKEKPLWIILRATFLFKKGDVVEGKKLVARDLKLRHEKQPYDSPSAGSIFKNPNKEGGIFSGKLIELVGLKGHAIGGAQISEKHGNFILNRGKATSEDVLTLISLAQSKVKDKFDVILEPEIVIVPSDGGSLIA